MSLQKALKNIFPESRIILVFLATPLLGFAQLFSEGYSQTLLPPRVDPLSSSTELIPSPYSLNLSGPLITNSFNGVSAKSALEWLADVGGYDFVYVKSDPLYSSSSPSSSSITSRSNDATGLFSPINQATSATSRSQQNQQGQQSLDGERLIYLNLKDREYSSALNSILLASGLQATFKDGIIYAGPDIDTKPIGQTISKTFRLNQVTAKAAGEFLGNLGATVYLTTTVTTSVSEGISSDEQVAGSSSTNTNSSTSTPEATLYSSKVGPLVGLLGVTDERLASISLVGNPNLVDLAESFLLKIDAKQRQVALDIQIIDFDLNNDFVAGNTSCVLHLYFI